MDGIGIEGSKLGNDRENLERFRASGLRAAICFPTSPSILPLPPWPGPEDPAVRIEEVCRGIRRLAAFEPACCVCLTGPQGDYEAAEARELVVDGLRKVARAAADVGVCLALEPNHASIRDDYTIVTTIPETVELVREIDDPSVSMVFDVWHLWDTPDLLSHTREHASRFVGVHVNDWREPTRGWCDRVLPGDGVADLPGIFGALNDGGFDGWFELEVLSDDGTFGDDYPDSLWKLDPVELIRTGREQFMRAWKSRPVYRKEVGDR